MSNETSSINQANLDALNEFVRENKVDAGVVLDAMATLDGLPKFGFGSSMLSEMHINAMTFHGVPTLAMRWLLKSTAPSQSPFAEIHITTKAVFMQFAGRHAETVEEVLNEIKEYSI